MESSVAAATSTTAPAPPRPRLLLWGSHWGSLVIAWFVIIGVVFVPGMLRMYAWIPGNFDLLLVLIPTILVLSFSIRRAKLGYTGASRGMWIALAAILGTSVIPALVVISLLASVVFHWGH